VVGGHSVHLREESGPAQDRPLMTIDVLPDDVLVEIFSYVNMRDMQNQWHALVHVCRRWRYVIFASPRRLNLRLAYGGHRPMSEMLDTWPVLPVILIFNSVILLHGELPRPTSDQRWNNIVAALESEHHNRICEIYITGMTKAHWQRLAPAMQKSFPELTHLELWVDYWNRDFVPVLPDSFLGGSAPRLQELSFGRIPFPSMPKLLLSANGLVSLILLDIPYSGYFSPDMMATALTVMTRLETLNLYFRSPQSRPDPASRTLPPPARFVLPTLTQFTFGGVYGYLEDLLARIDAPHLYNLYMACFIPVNFDGPQLRRLIGQAENFNAFDRAEVLISGGSIRLSLYPKRGAVDHRTRLVLQVICEELDWQLSSLAQTCSSFFPLISTLEELKIRETDHLSSSHWRVNVEDTQWVELLDPFIALKNLYLMDEIARRVCAALKQLSEQRATEVLPALHNLVVDGSGSLEDIQETIRPFVAARRLSGHPVAIHHLGRKSVLGINEFSFPSHLLSS